MNNRGWNSYGRSSYRRSGYRSPEYYEAISSPHWRQIRHVALKRSGNRCENCHQFSRSLDGHHWRGYAMLGQETPADIKMLCRPCHDWAHGRLPGEHDFARGQTSRRNGYRRKGRLKNHSAGAALAMLLIYGLVMLLIVISASVRTP